MNIFGQNSIQIPVLAIGKGWLAADKPSGMTVHNESGSDLCSYAAAFVRQSPAIRRQIEPDPKFGVHPVHRLDKETSGVILLAVDRETFRFFSNQFELHQAKKRYVAILHGRLEHPDKNGKWGIWRWPLSKTAGGRNFVQGPKPRQTCGSRFQTLSHSVHYTMVEIEPLSGRVHQIRRHAKLAGHPVVGDTRYGSTRAANHVKLHHGFDRLALHAHALTVKLPGEEKPATIQTRKIPDLMRNLFEQDAA